MGIVLFGPGIALEAGKYNNGNHIHNVITLVSFYY